MLCRSNGEGPLFIQYYKCLHEPGLVGLVFVLASSLEWPEVPTVFVLANFRPAFGTSDGVGSVGFIWLGLAMEHRPGLNALDRAHSLYWWMSFHLVVSEHDALDTHSRERRCAGRDGAEGIFGWDRNECIESTSNAAWVGPQSCRNESPLTHITSLPFSSLSVLTSDAYQDIQARRTAKNSQTSQGRSNPIQSSPAQGCKVPHKDCHNI